MIEINDDIKLIRAAETDSTNSMLRRYGGEEGRLFTVATADYQTAGRGQAGNAWESEPGRNLLLSIRLHPQGLEASRQFALTEAGALAVRDVVGAYAGEVSVKWPNDVYVGHGKVSGTLSECDVSGRLIKTCTLGIGINVNQREFRSGAPNPVSLAQAAGCDIDRDEVLGMLLARLRVYVAMVNAGRYDRLHGLYMDVLYRRHGLFEYEDASGRFMAEVVAVEPQGRLVLRRQDGRTVSYGLKEVKFIINNQ